MAVGKERLEAILRRFQALSQRQSSIQNLIQLLAQNSPWRSPDGELALEMGPEERLQIRTWLRDFMDESQAIIDSIRAEIAEEG